MSSLTAFVPSKPLSTPVLFLVFNRLDTTKQVFEAIRKAKPPRLYVACDGARENKDGETVKVEGVKNYILDNVDWKCDVQTLFRPQNLGCKVAVSSAIDWFFENEEMGIVLEDDCLPSQSFFWYCEELLHKYKDSDDVYLISGDGRSSKFTAIEDSYAFTKYPMIWGWASWARVWKNYDVKMESWPRNKTTFIDDVSDLKGTQRFWIKSLSSVYNDKIDTWDFQFSYLLLLNKGKCVVPQVNMITNIGFGEGATHTFDIKSESANVENHEISFPLKHPKVTLFNDKINCFYDRHEFNTERLYQRIVNRVIKAILK
jgi:hypothetical protein